MSHSKEGLIRLLEKTPRTIDEVRNYYYDIRMHVNNFFDIFFPEPMILKIVELSRTFRTNCHTREYIELLMDFADQHYTIFYAVAAYVCNRCLQYADGKLEMLETTTNLAESCGYGWAKYYLYETTNNPEGMCAIGERYNYRNAWRAASRLLKGKKQRHALRQWIMCFGSKSKHLQQTTGNVNIWRYQPIGCWKPRKTIHQFVFNNINQEMLILLMICKRRGICRNVAHIICSYLCSAPRQITTEKHDEYFAHINHFYKDFR